MEEWKEYKLGEVLTIKYGKDHKQLKDGSFPVYGSGGIMRYANKYIYEGPSILIPRKGSLNNIMYSNNPFWTVDTMFWTIINDDIVNPLYLYYSIYKKDFASLNVGSAVPSLTVPVIEDIDICLPPRTIQDKIGSILKPLDDKIENNRKINENLEQQAQALFKSWFVDFEPFRDQPFVESELGMIPEGWRVDNLDNLCSFISRGLSPKYKDNTDQWVLGQTCVRNNIVTLTNARTHEPKANTEKKVKQWDTLINSTGIGSLGRVGIVYFDKDNIAFDSHLTVVRTKDELYKHYIGRNLLMRQLEIEKMAIGSTGQTELPKESVKTMQLIVPDKASVQRFNKIIEPIALRMYHTYEENNNLIQLRDTILPKLMSGEIKL